MKKFATYLIILLIAFSCTTSHKKTDRTFYELKGNVKSFYEKRYLAIEKAGEIQKDIKENENSEGGERTIFFNEEGSMLEIRTNDSFESKYICTIDNKGLRTEANAYNSEDKLVYKETYKYDNKGELIEQNSFKEDGSLESKYTAKYDDDGNQIENDFYNSDGKFNSKVTYVYDKKGKMIELNAYNSTGNFEVKIIYKYDNKGNQIEQDYYYQADGSLSLMKTYKYDEKGNKIEFVTIKPDGTIVDKKNYKYEYDKEGNWIKEIEFINDIPKHIVERKIEYFK